MEEREPAKTAADLSKLKTLRKRSQRTKAKPETHTLNRIELECNGNGTAAAAALSTTGPENDSLANDR